MSEDALRSVLRLVAEGRLTAGEAAPLLDALDADASGAGAGGAGGALGRADAGIGSASGGDGRGEPRFARIEVVEGGRKAVNLRVPLSLGRRALSAIPGLSSADAAGLSDAISRGLSGPIVDIEDEDGDGVRIVLE